MKEKKFGKTWPSFYKSSTSWLGFCFLLFLLFSAAANCLLLVQQLMGRDWPSGRRCFNPPGAAALALLLAREAWRQKDQSFPSQVHEHSWEPCMRVVRQRLYCTGGLGDVLQQTKDPMHRPACLLCPFPDTLWDFMMLNCELIWHRSSEEKLERNRQFYFCPVSIESWLLITISASVGRKIVRRGPCLSQCISSLLLSLLHFPVPCHSYIKAAISGVI